MKSNTKNIRKGVTAILFVAIMIVCAFAVVPMVKADSDTTWTVGGSPYYITEDFLVEEGVTLTIEPGVEVRFDPGIALQVDGQLIAQGTDENAIIFTSNSHEPAPGDWNGILFTDTSVPATYDVDGYYTSGCIMQYCTVEYGGGSNTPAIKVVSSSLFVDHCTVVNNAWSGIHVQGTVYYGAGGYVDVGSAKITNNLISDNSAENGGGICTDMYSTVTISGNTIRDNSATECGGGIRIERSVARAGCSATISDNIISDNSANYGGGGISIRSNSAVTISGNTISGNSANYGGGIHVGSFNNVIINDNTISDNSVRYHGSGGISAGYCTATISGNTISNNDGGIALRMPPKYATYTITHNVITGNVKNGISLYSGSQPTINYNDIYDNTPYDVYTYYHSGGNPDVDATNNWWGTNDEATIQEHIYDGNDDPNLGFVDYIPFTGGIANQPPVADAGPDQTVEQANYQGADVTLDGSGSNDPGGDPLTYSWTWDDGSATGVNPTVSLPLGTTMITLIVNDGTVDSDSDTVVITVQDTTPPVITCPADVTVNTDSGVCYATGVALGSPTVSDNCDTTPTVANNAPTQFSKGTTTVTWTATDASGNSATCTQTVTVNDNEAPTITCPANVEIECDESTDPVDTGYATATDNCDPSPAITYSDSTSGTCPEVITRTWTATDECDNFASCTQTITVVDTTAPVITCPVDVEIECDESTDPVDRGYATATDNCDTSPAITYSDSTSGTCPEVITRTWTATDECDNFASCTQTITVVDTTAPVITCPVDVEIECDESTDPVDTGYATATDNCDTSPAITYSDSTSGTCPEVITRTWTATDECDNFASCTQTITVVDTTAPVITCPVDVEIECDESTDPVDTGYATATDNCDTSPAITYSDSTSGTCPEVITRTWTATDECDNFASCTQTITVVDTTPPSVDAEPDITVEQVTAAGTEVTLSAEVSDICDANPTVTWSHGPTAVFPLGSTEVTVTATDASGNSQSDTVVVTVIDTTLPEISVAVRPDTLWPANHKMVDITATVTATDICDAAPTVVLTDVTSNEPDDAKGKGDGKTVDDIQGADIDTEDYDFQLRAERAGGGDGRVYTISYTVTDASGNSASASATVVVPHDMG